MEKDGSVKWCAFVCLQKAFDIYPDKTAVCKAVKTNLRAEMSSVPEYLLSRSVAGMCSPQTAALQEVQVSLHVVNQKNK